MEHTITKFDLEAAFKALDEIEIPAAKRGRMSRNEVDLKEAFKRPTLGAKTEALVEEFYDVPEELPEAKAEREDEIAKAKLARIEKIVDLDAETPEDILPSYEGKIIIQCPQCMTLFYKDAADIEKSESDESICNVGEKCQHCGNEDGYTIIGKVAAAEIPAEDLPEEEAPVEEPAEEKTEEPIEEVSEENKEETKEESENTDLNLDLKEIPEEEEEKKEESLQTEGQPLTEDKISAAEIKDRLASFIKDNLQEECTEKEEIIKGDEPLKEASKEVSDAEFKKLINSRIWNEDLEDAGRQVDEIATEIEDAGAEEEIKEEEKEDSIKEELTSDPGEIERRLEQKADELQYEDLDDESFNEQITSCLNKIYKNTESFKATECSLNESNQLIIEGKLKFKSGKEKDISFICESYENKDNKIRFKLVSEALSDAQIFARCSLDENKSLLTESCAYTIKKKIVEGKITDWFKSHNDKNKEKTPSEKAPSIDDETIWKNARYKKITVVGMNADYRLNDKTKKNFKLNELKKAQDLAMNISKAGTKSELGATFGLVYLTKTDADKCTNANCLLQYKEGREVANNIQKINDRLAAENKVHGVIGNPKQKKEDQNNPTEEKKETVNSTEENPNKVSIENDKKDGVEQTPTETKEKGVRKINTTPINVSTKLKADEVMQKGKEAGRSDQSLKNLVTRLKKLGLAENKQEQ